MIESDYNKVLNDVFDVVQPNVSPVAFSVFMAVWRKTVGFNKKSDRISLTQLEKATGLTRPTVIKAMAELVAKKLILDASNKRGNSYEIQLNNLTSKNTLLVKSVNQTSKGILPKTSKGILHTKDITKDILQKTVVEREGALNLPEYEPPAHSHKKSYRQLNLLALPDYFKQEVRKRSKVSDERLEIEFIKFDTYWLQDKVSGVSKSGHDWACQFAGQVRTNLLEKPDDTVQAELHVQEVLRQQQQRRMEHEQRKANALTPEQGRQHIRQLRKTMAGVPHGTA